MKLSISKEIFENFPDLRIGVLIARDIDNKGKKKEISKLTEKLKINKKILQKSEIKSWRKAYKKFGANPEKYKPSLESLVSTAISKGSLPSINKLVDIYNYISLKYTIPVGGSDLDKINGNIFLRFSNKKEKFIPLNQNQLEYTKPGEVVYSDEEKIITRRWNWKESDLAKFTESTNRAILEIETLSLKKDLNKILKDLANLIEKHCEGNCEYFILDKETPTLDIERNEISDEYIEYEIEEEPKKKKLIKKKPNKMEKPVIELIQKEIDIDKNKILNLIEVPPDPELGDLAFPCFKLSKKLKKDPTKIAEELEGKIKLPKDSIFEKIQSKGPYLNFFFDKTKLAKQTLEKLWKERENYGWKEKTDKTAVVEFPSPNTNKPLHIGHLRNMALGESVSRLLESQGYEVKRVNLYNDRGIHICKSMLGYKKWGKGKKPDKKPDHFVGDFYVLFNKKAKNNPELEEEARDMLRKWEANDKATMKLWKKMNKWAYEGFKATYEKFGVRFDKNYFESETYEKGKAIVREGLEKGIFYKDETGAVVVDLGELGEKVLLRSDGTSVYITQDLYLAELKYDEYKFDKSIYVVGNEQNYHFKVLFKLLKKLGFEFADGCYHLSYGMVYLPKGRLKSREGKIVDADDLMKELSNLAREEIKSRHELSKNEIENLSELIGLGALKYYLLKFSPSKDFLFKPEESIPFEGETGPYLQYSSVRARRILEKSEIEPKIEVEFDLLNKPEEKSIIKKLSSFQETIEEAANSYSPHLLAKYAFELASEFNLFYEKWPVINAKNEELKKARLLLVYGFNHIINSCLNLLGIRSPEKM